MLAYLPVLLLAQMAPAVSPAGNQTPAPVEDIGRLVQRKRKEAEISW